MKNKLVIITACILIVAGFGGILDLGNVNVKAEGPMGSTSNSIEVWIKEPGIRIDIQSPSFQSMCPEVIRLPNGTLRMFYTETTGYNHMRIMSAISTNGLDWQLELGVRIDRGSPGAQDDWSTLSPEIVELPNGKFRMFYDGYNGGGGAHSTCILSAISTDGLTWIKESGRRVNYGNYGDWDHWAAGGPSIVKLENGTYRMYYHGKTDNVVRYRILSAFSKDCFNWFKEPGLRIDVGYPYDSRSAIYCDVIKLTNGQLKMYYTGSDGTYTRILSAISNDGLNWIKNPGIRVDKGGQYDSTGAFHPNIISISNNIQRMYYVGNDGRNPRILSAVNKIINISVIVEKKHEIMDYIQNLPDDTFDKNPQQRKNALENKFIAVDHQLEAGAYQGAINKLSNDIRPKMDGLGQDWIIAPTAQKELCEMIDALIEYLEIVKSN